MVQQNNTRRVASRWAVAWIALLAIVVIPAGVQSEEAPKKDLVANQVTVPQEEPLITGTHSPESLNRLDNPLGESPKTNVAPVGNAVASLPIEKEYEPFQGTWNFEYFGSLKWSAEPQVVQSWEWVIQGREITWNRPGQQSLNLSFSVATESTRESKKWPNEIEFTFLNGPDQGQKCQGSYYQFADTGTVWICFQDPGSKGNRPQLMSFNGYDKNTVIAIHPARPKPETGEQNQPRIVRKESKESVSKPVVPIIGGVNPLGTELQVLQGTWSFSACESVLWYTELDVIRNTWNWQIKGQEITWTRAGKETVKLSFKVDPSKTPNQIDFTYLDGPDKGKTCPGIYEFERNSLWICMAEPGAIVERPTKMAMSSTSKTALIILQDRNNPPTSHEAEPASVIPVPHPIPEGSEPAVATPSPFRDTLNFANCYSSKWTDKREVVQTWQWTIQDQEILWTRPNQETIRMSFTVEPHLPNPRIALTFLNGPEKGNQCLGYYTSSKHRILLWIQNPGPPVALPPWKDFAGGKQCNSIELVPARIPSPAEEIADLEGVWRFEIYYSDWWPARISNPPISWSNWRWTVKGNEITWTGMKVDDVKLSFTVDPTTSPRQIDLTFLDGPHKGKRLRGMYQFTAGNGCHICFADPDANVDRPLGNHYGTNQGHTMVDIEKVVAEVPSATGTSPVDKGK